jgi:glycosyltransferase involved in cell wall biosynthesis
MFLSFMKNTMNSPLVSIVIPCFNHSTYLAMAINSVLSQTYKNTELIVLDDGSTDNTRIILSQYKDNFFWETHKNMGQSLTLNKGWKMSRGDILAYLSADDILYPKAVELCVGLLMDNPDASLCYPDFDLIDPYSELIRSVSAPEYSYHEMITNFVCAPGVGSFFRRSCYEKAGEWDSSYRHHPDYEYWLRLGLQGPFIHLPERLGAFRVHEDSQSFHSASVNQGDEPLRIIKSFFDRKDLPKNIEGEFKLAMSNACFMAAQTHLRSGFYLIGAKRIFEAAKYSIHPFYTSIKPYKKIINGLLNKFIHRMLWRIKHLFSR